MNKRAVLAALRRVVGSRQTGMLPSGANKMARREASAANIEDAAVLQPDRARAAEMNNAALRMRTTTRTNNANPISVVDNEFDAPKVAAGFDAEKYLSRGSGVTRRSTGQAVGVNARAAARNRANLSTLGADELRQMRESDGETFDYLLQKMSLPQLKRISRTLTGNRSTELEGFSDTIKKIKAALG